jgi:hypothetical protein
MDRRNLRNLARSNEIGEATSAKSMKSGEIGRNWRSDFGEICEIGRDRRSDFGDIGEIWRDRVTSANSGGLENTAHTDGSAESVKSCEIK